MNDEQTKMINKEIDRLEEKKHNPANRKLEGFKDYIAGRQDGLKWVKENL